MDFRTPVDIPQPPFKIQPCEPLLFVGSCFADNIGQRFREEGFPVTVNPYGTMYNPASVLHTIERLSQRDLPLSPATAVPSASAAVPVSPSTTPAVSPAGSPAVPVPPATTPAVSPAGSLAVPVPPATTPAASPAGSPALPASLVFLTLGTNHIYRLKETGAIVDNCEKRPQSLFTEEILSVDECAAYLSQTVDILRQCNPDVRIVLTVSPIRYRQYGYHESQLSKATLLLAIDRLQRPAASAAVPVPPSAAVPAASAAVPVPPSAAVLAASAAVPSSPVPPPYYFPAYEIMMDELRDYRFYAPAMLHPSPQAVAYLWERLVDTLFSDAAKTFLDEWRPLKQLLAHKPFNADSEEYRTLMDKTMLKVEELRKKYSNFAL